MQSKEELEKWYEASDPWRYENNKDDIYRKYKLINLLANLCPGESILDIGAGEGWVTKDLPYTNKYATDLSDTAESRFPKGVAKYEDQQVDVTLTMGTLYEQYNHETIAQQIKDTKAKFVVVAGIEDWLIDYDFGKQIHTETFPYREYEQRITIYETRT